MARKQALILLALVAASTPRALCTDTAPLKLVTRYEYPSDVKGKFDHLVVDLQGHRLFTAAMDHKSVEVFDIRTGKLIHSITAIQRPHALLYREDLQRLYVTDADAAELKIFDGKTYQLIKAVKLLGGADAIAYDPATKYLYVVNGGDEIKAPYSLISVVDTTIGQKVGDIRFGSETLEGMVLEKSSPKMYVNNRAKNRVDVIDRNTHQLLASWPVTLGKVNDPVALDEANHRLFVGCRSGQVVIFDTETGKELQALPIGDWVDEVEFDPATKRIYAACGGTGNVDVYEETDPDHYKSIGKIPSGPWGKNGRLVPELNRYFVPVPQHGNKNAEVLVYSVQ
jgi:DNA-binding beta-propeller fold protein YncE